MSRPLSPVSLSFLVLSLVGSLVVFPGLYVSTPRYCALLGFHHFCSFLSSLLLLLPFSFSQFLSPSLPLSSAAPSLFLSSVFISSGKYKSKYCASRAHTRIEVAEIYESHGVCTDSYIFSIRSEDVCGGARLSPPGTLLKRPAISGVLS